MRSGANLMVISGHCCRRVARFERGGASSSPAARRPKVRGLLFSTLEALQAPSVVSEASSGTGVCFGNLTLQHVASRSRSAWP